MSNYYRLIATATFIITFIFADIALVPAKSNDQNLSLIHVQAEGLAKSQTHTTLALAQNPPASNQSQIAQANVQAQTQNPHIANNDAEQDFLFILRVDDILSRNTTMLPRSIIPFQEMAESKGAIVSWGVMPHRLLERNVNDGELTRDLLTSVANGHEISLHGFIHLCQQCQNVAGSAFWGHEMYCTTLNRPLTYNQQAKLIEDGLKLLADSIGVRPTSFIPPGHVSDNTTHQVLIDRDFHAITIETDEGFVTDGLYNIGTSEDFGWELTPGNYVSRRTQALEDIRIRGEAQGHYTLLLHDPFTRYGYREGILIDWTAEILDSVKTMYGDRLKFVNISEAADILSGTGTSAHENDTDVPIAAKLHANYPNP
ncbi:MAG: DUF2334 domain-containing protein, partial [Balneolales bacterium]|nr:DUF2334 domain-containing protein [Balneolales bacterium]